MKIDLSIIIPTYNRGEIFAETLRSACIAVKNISSEIIVVNDYKKDDLKIENLSKEIKIINNPKQGAASARNYGFSVSSGEIILFLDDDMIVSEEVISELMNYTRNNNKKIISPNWVYPDTINSVLRKSKFGRFLYSIDYNSLKGWLQADGSWDNKKLYKNTGVASYCLMLRREDFLQFGGYDENFAFAGCEDYDLTKRLKNQSFEFYINPTLMIFHNENDRLELQDWLNRKRRNGYTQKNAVEIGYKEMEIHYKGIKLFLIKILWQLKFLLYAMARSIPNLKIFDPLYLFFVKTLTGIYIYAGYKIDYIKK